MQEMQPVSLPVQPVQHQQEPVRTFLTTRDVQRLIRVDKSTIYRMAEAGKLPAVKIGRQWRFPAAEIERWLHERRTGVAVDGDPDFVTEAQQLIDLYAHLEGVMAVLTDMDGNPVTEPSNPCGYLQAILDAPRGHQRCGAEWKSLDGHLDLTPAFRMSDFGYLCARAIIRVGNRLDGMVVAGCVAPEDWPPPRSVLEEIAHEIGIHPAALVKATGGIYHLDEDAQDRVLGGLSVLATHLSRLAARRQASIPRVAAATHERRSTT